MTRRTIPCTDILFDNPNDELLVQPIGNADVVVTQAVGEIDDSIAVTAAEEEGSVGISVMIPNPCATVTEGVLISLPIENHLDGDLVVQVLQHDPGTNSSVVVASTTVSTSEDVNLEGVAVGSGDFTLEVVSEAGADFVVGALHYMTTEQLSENFVIVECNTDNIYGNDYRFGFNGQQKDNELKGLGNHNSAMFWEYDTRLGRRLNLDPVDQVSISNYATFGNNPIAFTDPLGDKKGDPVLKDDNKGTKGSMAPNGGTRDGAGGIMGGDAFCKSCGPRGEDTWGYAEPQPLGGSGDLNLMQAAAMDVGRNDANREKVRAINNFAQAWMVTGVVAPVAAVAAIETSPVWGPSLINSLRFSRSFGWKSAVADAGAQWLWEGDWRKINVTSVVANGYIPNFLWSSAPGAFFNLSYNSVFNPNPKENSVLKNPTDKTVWINLMTNSMGNLLGGFMGKGLKTNAVFPYMSSWGEPVGNFFGNVSGAAVQDAIVPKKE